jgi:hypothetical protein
MLDAGPKDIKTANRNSSRAAPVLSGRAVVKVEEFGVAVTMQMQGVTEGEGAA